MSTSTLPRNVLLFPGAQPPVLPEAVMPTFRHFLDHIHNREIVDAADCLAVLLNLEEERAYHATLHFLGHYRRDRTRAMGKIMRLRLEAHEENVDTVLLLLRECFGLVGQEAASLLDPLREAARPA